MNPLSRQDVMANKSMRCLAALLLVWSAVWMGGCGTYQLQGKTIAGPVSAVYLVDRDDPRLEAPGLSGARVSVMLDPDRLSAKRVGEQVADLDGRFAIPVQELGAGVLEYDVRLDARLAGRATASERFRLPGRGKRVLVVLAEGEGDAVAEDVLEETLRWGEPYMN